MGQHLGACASVEAAPGMWLGSRGCPVQCLRSTSLCFEVPVGPQLGIQGLQS